MRRIVRFPVTSWSLVAAGVGLFGCPQLLDDNFSMGLRAESDAGAPCQGGECGVPDSGRGGGDVGLAGSAGSSAAGGVAGVNIGGTAGNSAGSAGASASAGSAATGGAGSTANARGSAGDGGSGGSAPLAACRTFELSDTTQSSASNCVGIVGWNAVAKDTGSTLALSFQDGDPCFSGTIAASGWGAVYDLTFTEGNGSTWNATSHGVTGFNFLSRGASPPASFKVIYKGTGATDFCRVVSSGNASVLFSEAHPSCSSNASDRIVDTTELVELILAFTPSSQAYALNFCLQMTALE